MALEGRNDEGAEDAALAARAAWLYHAGGMTQSAVARALGVSGIKAHRLLARAARDGIVRVLVDGPIGGCIELEQALIVRFGLRTCRVVPNLGEDSLPVQALGQAGAALLRARLEGAGARTVLGLGHGRSVAACVRYLPQLDTPGLRLVSLLGGLPRLRAANPYEMVHLFAERTGAEAWLVPVPFFASSAGDRPVLLAQRGVAEALALACDASLCLVGVGEAGPDAFLCQAGAVTAAEIKELRAIGAVGEVLGQWFDAEGRLVAAALHERVIAAPLAQLQGLTAVAGGPTKVRAIQAVLRARVLDGLITDDETARQVLAGPETKTTTGETSCTTKRKTPPTPSLPAELAAAS